MQFLNILNKRLVGIWRQCPPVILSKVDVYIEGNGKNSRCALQKEQSGEGHPKTILSFPGISFLPYKKQKLWVHIMYLITSLLWVNVLRELVSLTKPKKVHTMLPVTSSNTCQTYVFHLNTNPTPTLNSRHCDWFYSQALDSYSHKEERAKKRCRVQGAPRALERMLKS